MAYRKSTLRSMSPVTRKVARLIGEQESIARRFKNLIPDIKEIEFESQALRNSQKIDKGLEQVTYLCRTCTNLELGTDQQPSRCKLGLNPDRCQQFKDFMDEAPENS